MSCDAPVQPLLEVHGLVVRRRSGFAIELPELRLLRGRTAALYGPSGCGKTTVLNALLNLLPAAECRVEGDVRLAGTKLAGLAGRPLRQRLRRDVIFLAQDAHAALDPLESVGRQIRHATDRGPGAVVAALTGLGIADADSFCRRRPHELSGGEAQRVLLAMAFLRRPALVVADEPSASLDGGSYAELLGQLRQLLARDSCLLLATHDQRLLRDLDASVHAAAAGRFVPSVRDELHWPERRGGPEPDAVPVLSARGLRLAYGRRVVLDGVDFSVLRGEIVAILGESGAGKTTLARVLAAHRRPDAGEVERPARVGSVQLCCQDASGSLTPGRTLEALVAEARHPFFDLPAVCRELQFEPALLRRPGVAMSGGERRRAVLLRALAVHPDVVILDEPTAALDRPTAVAVLESLQRLQRSRALTVVLITHDLELARAIADRVVVMAEGKLSPC